jgi:hypothetical protein
MIRKLNKRLDDLSDEYLTSDVAKKAEQKEMAVALAQTAAVALFGMAFMKYNEGWSWLDALYFVVITGTTVGYGDQNVQQQSSLIFLTFYIVLCVIAVR